MKKRLTNENLDDIIVKLSAQKRKQASLRTGERANIRRIFAELTASQRRSNRNRVQANIRQDIC